MPNLTGRNKKPTSARHVGGPTLMERTNSLEPRGITRSIYLSCHGLHFSLALASGVSKAFGRHQKIVTTTNKYTLEMLKTINGGLNN